MFKLFSVHPKALWDESLSPQTFNTIQFQGEVLTRREMITIESY